MNIAESIYARDKGFNNIQGYNIGLLRLKCYKKDVYQGVSPNVDALDYNPNPPVYACKFSSVPGQEHILALANEDGKLALQNTNFDGSQDPLEGTQAHNNAIFDLAWMPHEPKLITASGDRTAALWDTSTHFRQIQVFRSHSHTVKCAVFRPEDRAVFATGGRDGAIMIWDTRASHSGEPRPDSVILNAHEVNVVHTIRKNKISPYRAVAQSVTSLAFQDYHTLISCSAGDGLIKVWDLRKTYTSSRRDYTPKYKMNYGGNSSTYNGFTSLLVCPSGLKLYASCVDKIIYAYNIGTYSPQPTAEYYGHGFNNVVLSFFVKACLSPDGEYLISGSNDETAYIWHTKSPGIPVVKLSGHRDEVTCIAWCGVRDMKIITCSDDCHHRIWRINSKPIEEDEKENIYGKAEVYVLPPDYKDYNLPTLASTSRSATSTPRSMYRTSYYTDSSGSGKRSRSRLSADFWSCEKRQTILSPILENLESSPKRSGLDTRAARKLHFGPAAEAALRSPAKEKIDEIVPSSSLATPYSPTSGLPNFVIDGTAPHLLANSPLKKTKVDIDWLTKLRKRKSTGQSGCGTVSEDLSSPKNRKTPTRRVNRLKLAELKKTPKSSNFFVPSIKNFYTNSILGNPKAPPPYTT